MVHESCGMVGHIYKTREASSFCEIKQTTISYKVEILREKSKMKNVTTREDDIKKRVTGWMILLCGFL